ncbi:MAG: HAMP domain-containing histidine kinase [Myxococcaceae bacterium]|nr:HAMP domain-containing histidine kinase [Myxococcaceae bacterium]
MRHAALVIAMVLAVTTVIMLALWDAERESAAAIDRLALSETTLAHALALDLDTRLASARAAGAEDAAARTAAIEGLLQVAGTLETPRPTLVLVRHGEQLVGALPSSASGLTALLTRLDGSQVLDRAQAVALGFPPRRAVASYRPSSASDLGVLVLASAVPEREHAQREELLTALAIVLTSCMVLGFGVTALLRDRERLTLEHALDRQRLERERDEQLGRAERVAVASALSIGIAHELATPLTVIASRAQSLRRHALDESAEAAVAAVLDQVASMRSVMHGFLALARGEAPHTGPLSPVAVAREAAKAVMHRYAAGNVRLELEAADGLPQVQADETLLRQALVNLLTNAVQASAPGTTVTVRLRAQAGKLDFEVLDQGHGIDPKVATRLAEPFVTTRAHAGGTGLGLAITQELARHHGGTLTLRPRDGGGTQATLTLPLRPGETP